ncbi:MAG: CaiB/BaiF CoA-transferase family protein [Acidimicrobiia bacterium]|jgi:formyl-CoA transferase
MRLGDIANAEAQKYGKPLDGIRVLAIEQMQALPYATQMLARFGADVVKVEAPGDGESGRGSQPAMTTPDGKRSGATFLRNNLDKRSITVNLKHPKGKELILALAPLYDVVAENFKGGTMKRLGLDYEAVAAVAPRTIYLSVSGFGNMAPSPYDGWGAYAPIVEAMSGIYDYKWGDQPPVAAPVGALGDISSAIFGVIGVMAALIHRDRTGEGQYVDVAMFDSMVAMTDLVTNFWSMGMREGGRGGALIMDGFRANNGYFVLQVAREHQFERLAKVIGQEGWLTDPRFATRQGWADHLEDTIRPAIEGWAADKTKLEAATVLNSNGLVAGPSFTAPEVIADPHVKSHNMLVEMPRVDDVPEPVLIPGNPVKMSKVSEGPETRVPWVGEHTDGVLAADLGLSEAEVAALRDEGVVG